LELIPYIFDIEGVGSFPSEKLSQDALEKLFGILRQCGKSNENQTVAQFLKSTQAIRVINAIWVGISLETAVGAKGKVTTLSQQIWMLP